MKDLLVSFDADLASVPNLCAEIVALRWCLYTCQTNLLLNYLHLCVLAVINRRFLEMSLQNDLRHVFAEDCARVMMTHGSAPAACKQYSEGQGLLAGHLTWPFLEEKSLELLL